MKNKTRPRSAARTPWPSALVALTGALVLAGCASTGDMGNTARGDGEGGGVGMTRPAAVAHLPALPPLPAPVDPAAAPPVAAATPPTAPTPVDPLRPGEKVDLDADAARADLWVRVRRGFAMPALEGELVRDREQWYASRPDYVARMTERAGRYLFHIVEEIERRGMPTELALLPFVESAFNPQAMSTAKASGMWQFIPSTGRDFLLRQNIFRDDRRDVLASTRAALDYLARLHAMFGDWHLALAAYNWGEGSVQRAIAKNERAGLPTDYASLRMPDETRLYVPKLQAVKNLVARPESFGLALPAVANHPYFLSVPIDRDIDVDMAVRLAGVSLEEFKTLNPQMNKPVILAAGTPQILLPYDNANQFVKRLALHRGPLASWTAWAAPRTLRPADAAREVGMSEDELRDVNRIPFKMLVKAGSTLLVPRADSFEGDVSGQVADNATMALTPELEAVRRSPPRPLRREAAARSAVAGRHVLAAQPQRTVERNNRPSFALVAAPRPSAGRVQAAAASPPRRGAAATVVVHASAGKPAAARVTAAAPAPAAHAAKDRPAVRVAVDDGKKAAAHAPARSAKAMTAPAASAHRIRVALGR